MIPPPTITALAWEGSVCEGFEDRALESFGLRKECNLSISIWFHWCNVKAVVVPLNHHTTTAHTQQLHIAQSPWHTTTVTRVSWFQFHRNCCNCNAQEVSTLLPPESSIHICHLFNSLILFIQLLVVLSYLIYKTTVKEFLISFHILWHGLPWTYMGWKCWAGQTCPPFYYTKCIGYVTFRKSCKRP